ncbi:MAG: hypothetical protein ABS81_04110 [Pseudonocardia sp. SCN 72-86]|nr:MAG: hypothetical protein ABS81_04110 [Pseudonocardia sp. SCN 72-86]
MRDLIMSGEINVGTRLRVEQLARAFDVSLTPAREALIALHGEGFLRLEARRGYIVAALSKRDLEDIFDLQAYIAGRLAGRAALALSDAELDELDALQRTIEDAHERGDHQLIEETNYRLHKMINSVGESDKLSWMLRLLNRYVPYRFYGSVETWRNPDPDIHRSVLAGLRDRNPRQAEERMRAHIDVAGVALIEYLQSHGHFDATNEHDGPTDPDDLAEKIESAMSRDAATPRLVRADPFNS